MPLAATVRGWPRLLLSWPSHNILFPVSDVLPPARHGGAAARCTPATLSCGSGVKCKASVSELEPQKRLLLLSIWTYRVESYLISTYAMSKIT